jgi:hypothetical protein
VIADFGKGQAPAALGHFVRHGLALDPAERYPTVQAMRERLDAVREGQMPIECQVTFTQRLLSGLSRAANRHPAAVLATLFVSTLAVAGGLVALTLLLVR